MAFRDASWACKSEHGERTLSIWAAKPAKSSLVTTALTPSVPADDSGILVGDTVHCCAAWEGAGAGTSTSQSSPPTSSLYSADSRSCIMAAVGRAGSSVQPVGFAEYGREAKGSSGAPTTSSQSNSSTYVYVALKSTGCCAGGCCGARAAWTDAELTPKPTGPRGPNGPATGASAAL